MCHLTGKQSSQKDLILVLDTNILLSHLDYVKKIKSQGLGGIKIFIILKCLQLFCQIVLVV